MWKSKCKSYGKCCEKFRENVKVIDYIFKGNKKLRWETAEEEKEEKRQRERDKEKESEKQKKVERVEERGNWKETLWRTT